MEVNISTKLKYGNILYGCLRQVGCLIKVTGNTGLIVCTAAKLVVISHSKALRYDQIHGIVFTC